MPALVVVGAQWGDEGKGKLVDYLTSSADFVARFQGGNNAGHTLVVDGRKTKLSVMPSGILRAECVCLIGSGVVVNPDVLIQEINDLRAAGVSISPERLVIDRDAHIILECHGQVDRAREKRKGDKRIGTTGRGIGPAYEDRAARTGIRVGELLQGAALFEHLQEVCEEKDRYLRAVLESDERVDYQLEKQRLERAAELLGPYIGNVSLTLDRAVKRNARIVFEGAQGTLLDQAHGTVPFVTSSHTIAGAVTVGCGVGARAIDYTLGVAKAYTTRVGSGPFPTEELGPLGDAMRERGAEFGTITGRPRRCGWFDAFALQRAVRLNGLDGVAMTKLDVLSGFEELKVCVGYKRNGQDLEDLPTLAAELQEVVPQYIVLKGWSEDVSKVSTWNSLPDNLIQYLKVIEEIIACPIVIASIGAERESTLFSSAGAFVKSFVD
jgi:adenylosuccinate synthase